MSEHPSSPSPAKRPAVRLADSPRANLLIFEIDDRLHAADMGWMGERVTEAFARHGRIDILLLIRRFEGATAGAVLEPTALKAEAASVTHVRRYAVLGAPGWADAAITLGGWLSPIDSATFEPGQDFEARAWIDRP